MRPRPFRDLPIRRKLLLMTLASSAAALLMASGGFLARDVLQFRSEIQTDIITQARIVAESAGPAMTFNDSRAAGENIAVLQLRPRVSIACLYTSDGRLFATFARTRNNRCPSPPPQATHLGWSEFSLVTPVRSGSDTVGTLHVVRDLDDLYARLRVGLATMVGLLLLAIAAAFLTASRIQHAIVSPLLGLADIARHISAGRDYSLRAAPTSTDEVGVVMYAFNDMLDAIAERTTELSKANRELEREVEERRRVEAERSAALARERDANRLKDEFLATLSHELRTPLNAVLGWTRVLRATRVEPATQARALESIERNARAQARLIEDLLEISRIVTGKLRLHLQDVDLSVVVDDAVQVVQPPAAAKRITMHVEVGPRPAMTAGDPDRLQQVTWNLLSNAVKFTGTGGQVWVRLDRNDGYHLQVRDTGQGIDPQFLPFVFEPFRQADGTASREHGGLGLGLAIARQLVELHGGTIAVDSAGRGTGATFDVYLPSVAHPSANRILSAALATPAQAPGHVDPTLLRNIRVLVVDDEEDARVLMQTALQAYGANVVIAGSGADAIAAFDRQAPDVVVSDIGMPQEDGYALIRRIRARAAAKGGAVPAVAVTAYASPGDRLAAEAAGYQAHVAKPFDPAEVAALVARLTAARAR